MTNRPIVRVSKQAAGWRVRVNPPQAGHGPRMFADAATAHSYAADLAARNGWERRFAHSPAESSQKEIKR